MTVISVMLIVPDAPRAIDWYTTALGARELWNLGGVAGLDLDGAAFFLHEVNPLNLVERALAAGATPAAPVEDHEVPWGTHRQGGFTDPFGHNWSVGDKSPLRRFEG